MTLLQINIDLTFPYRHLTRLGNGILTYLLIYLPELCVPPYALPNLGKMSMTHFRYFKLQDLLTNSADRFPDLGLNFLTSKRLALSSSGSLYIHDCRPKHRGADHQ